MYESCDIRKNRKANCSVVRRLIFLETYEKKTTVGSMSKYNLKILINLAIGGLVGWWVVVSVGWSVGWPKGIGTGHIQELFPARSNCFFLRWNGKE
jgi:hypothetical protein